MAVDSIADGPVPAGMVVSRFIDIEGDTVPGPPIGVQIQNGTVTYDFAPAIASGMHLTSAALDATAQLKFGGPPGTTQALQVNAWDWSQSPRVSPNSSTAATTALPAHT